MNRFIIFICFFLIVGCSISTTQSPLYEGKDLVIGVIGELPDVREKNIKFISISFNDLETINDLSSQFDAVIITKEHLSEAAHAQYAKIYKTSGIPFFFMESTKSYFPFILEDKSYEDIRDISVKTGDYATGFLQLDEENIKYWGYGLYKNEVNKENVQDVYSRIFSTIESIEYSKLK